MGDFAWTDLEAMVDQRALEELLKRGQGDLKVKFSLPMCFIDSIDIFTNFRLQDPYGLSQTGKGEQGRYYYIERLDYDFMNHQINVTAVDLQYLLRQCIILGPCTIEENWMLATESERMYGYLCDCTTDAFPDGEPCKMLCPCRE